MTKTRRIIAYCLGVFLMALAIVPLLFVDFSAVVWWQRLLLAPVLIAGLASLFGGGIFIIEYTKDAAKRIKEYQDLDF